MPRCFLAVLMLMSTIPVFTYAEDIVGGASGEGSAPASEAAPAEESKPGGQGQNDYPVIVVGGADALTRGSLAGYTFTVTNAEGEEESFPLSDIADVSEQPGVSAIRRDAGSRYMTVLNGSKLLCFGCLDLGFQFFNAFRNRYVRYKMCIRDSLYGSEFH